MTGLYVSRVPVVREGWYYLDRDTRDVLYATRITHSRAILEGREKYRALLRESFAQELAPENALDRHELRRRQEAEAAQDKERELIHEFRSAPESPLRKLVAVVASRLPVSPRRRVR